MQGFIMRNESFSLTKLEQQIDEIEQDIEKIEFISSEILRCEKAIHNMESKVDNFITTEIKLSALSLNPENSFIELINDDNKIKSLAVKKLIKLCATKLCKKYNSYLKRAEFHLQHYKTKLESRAAWNGYSNIECNPMNQNSTLDRIVWRSGKENLFELFDSFYKNQIIPGYSKEEILSHFVDEKRIPYKKSNIQPDKFNWLDSYSAFAVFVDELAKRGAIDDENKYKVISKHFINKKGTEFKNLAQKKNYTNNFTQTGNLIRQIINKIIFSVIISFYVF
jgi:hypothetical protein